MRPVRLGVVGYLNSRPLVYGLDTRPELFALRFDPPSRCAELLHDNQIDLGLIPSIEYFHRGDYHIVPGVALVSKGPVASVALFASRPISALKTIAIDSSSRTSVALLRILCARRFDARPDFVTMAPDLSAMIERCGAALVIGDPALFADPRALGLEKVDLGQEWTAMTGLPFVYAFWAGLPGAVDRDDVGVLQVARDAGVAHVEEIAAASYPGDTGRARKAAEYLRDNMVYDLDAGACDGLRTFYELAAGLGLISEQGPLRFYEGA